MDPLEDFTFECSTNDDMRQGTLFDPYLIIPNNSSVSELTSFGPDESNQFNSDLEEFQQIAATRSIKEEPYETISPSDGLLDFDSDMKNNNAYPDPEVFRDRISNAVYDGPYDFQMNLVDNNDLQYSKKVNRLYIEENELLTISFRLKNKPAEKLYIRVTPAFEDAKNLQELVYRCPVHMDRNHSLNAGLSEDIIQHVLRTKNEEAQYVGNKNFNKRLSIIFPLRDPQVGEDDTRELFYFVCMTSCPSGMNRRLINLICTLETENGKTLGRQILKVKICKNTKRDRKHDENDLALKKKKKHDKDDIITPNKKRKLKNGTVENTFTISIDIGDEENKKEFIELLKAVKNKYNIKNIY